jgi:hypothetical protein
MEFCGIQARVGFLTTLCRRETTKLKTRRVFSSFLWLNFFLPGFKRESHNEPLVRGTFGSRTRKQRNFRRFCSRPDASVPYPGFLGLPPRRTQEFVALRS